MSPTHVLTATSTQSTIHELQCTTELCIKPQHGFHWAKTAIYWVCGFAHSRLKCLSTSERKTRKGFRIFPFLHEESSRGCSLPTQLKLYHRLIGFHMWVCEFTLLLTYSVSIQSKCGCMTVVQVHIYVSRRTIAPQSYITMHITTIWTIVLHTPATVKVTMTVGWHVQPPTHSIKVRKV